MTKTPTRIGSFKTLRWLAVYYLVFIIVVGLLWAKAHENFITGLRGYQDKSASSPEVDFPKLDSQQLMMLGWAQQPRSYSETSRSSYLRFSKVKKPGVIRIGFFGGSAVEGAETSSDFDFPSRIQRYFDTKGLDHVEVINFGVGAYGMHQSYLLWQYLGKHYDLDYVVFFPKKFHPNRDGTFDFDENSYNAIHARYIIEGEELRLIPVIGANQRDAVEIFHRFFPPWRYLHYDQKIPSMMRCLIPIGRTLRRNPFYYRPFTAAHEEIFATYRKIFDDILQQTTRLIVMVDSKSEADFGDNMVPPGAGFMKIKTQNLDVNLYLAPKRHLSALGNDVIARQVFAFLMGEERAVFYRIELSAEPGSSEVHDGSFEKPVPLYGYSSLAVKLGKYAVSDLVLHRTGVPSWRFRKQRFEEHLDVKNNEVASLLQIPGNEIKLIPLPFLQSAEDSVFVSFRVRGQHVQSPIGVARSRSGVLGTIEWTDPEDLHGRIKEGDGWNVEWNSGKLVIRSPHEIEGARVMVGEQEILRGKTSSIRSFWKDPFRRGGYKAVMQPILLDFVHLRARRGQFIDVETHLQRQGTLDLVLKQPDNLEKRISLAAYSVESTETSFDSVYGHPIPAFGQSNRE